MPLPPPTPRLVFRAWRDDDLDLAVSLWGDPEVTAFIDARGALDRDQVRARLEAEIAYDRAHGHQYWAVFLREGGELVGCCGLRPKAPGMLELGFHLRRAFWGRGLAREAAEACIRHAFGALGAGALFAGHHPDNAASRGLLAKLGFVRTHEELYPPTGLVHPAYRLERPA